MAGETLPKASEAAPAAAEVVISEVAPPAAAAEAEAASEEKAAVAASEEEPKKEEAEEVAVVGPGSASFKEESNVVADLQDPEKKALDEFKKLILSALSNKEFVPPPPPAAAKAEEPPAAEETPAKTEEEAPAAAAVEETPVKTEEEAPAAAEETPAKTEEVAPAASSAEEAPVKIEEAAPAAAADEARLVKTEEAAPAAAAAEEEAPAVDIPPPAAAETAAPPEAEPVVELAAEGAAAVAEVPAPPPAEEKAVVEEDGAKTVEAIEETIVAAPAPPSGEATPAESPEEVFIWGVPLVGDEKSDTLLLKFLRARDFKVKDAMAMIKSAVIWRKQFGIEQLLSEDLGVPSELEKVVFMHGKDKEGHPVCYNVYGEFQDKELYAKAFGDEEKRQRFLKWRIQFLEKGIRQHLDFTPGGVCTMVQVTDLKNVPGPGKSELRLATKQALALLQDNYPEFVAKQIFINVPWWYLAYNRMISSIFTQRSKSKFVFAGPSRSTETLFKYIAPEQVPVQYGGLSKENDPDFTAADAVTEATIKPSSKHTVEIPVTEAGLLAWELRALGGEVSYRAEFVPSAEDGYTVIIAKARKLVLTDQPVVKDSFKTGEKGRVVLTIDNTTSKKKKLLYRSKVKSTTE